MHTPLFSSLARTATALLLGGMLLATAPSATAAPEISTAYRQTLLNGCKQQKEAQACYYAQLLGIPLDAESTALIPSPAPVLQYYTNTQQACDADPDNIDKCALMATMEEQNPQLKAAGGPSAVAAPTADELAATPLPDLAAQAESLAQTPILAEEDPAMSFIPTSDAGFGARIGGEYRCSNLSTKIREGSMNLSDMYCYVLYGLEFSLYLVSSIAVLVIIWSGYQYMLSVWGLGDAEEALGNVRKALIGLVISSFAWVIIRVAEQLLA